MEPDRCKTQPGYYLTGQVVAAYIQVRLTLQDFGRPRKRDLANLHPGIFDSLKRMKRILEPFGLFIKTLDVISRASESRALQGSFLLP